jgi:hypothetical protein
MNGAELPCGSILRVEPADPQYKQQQSETISGHNDFGYYRPSSGAPVEGEEVETYNVKVSAENGTGGGKNETDAELDEFFDSL